MLIIMLGAPGSGKGTIGEEICKHYNLIHIATGDIFRDEIKRQTELGKKANEYISKGMLVPDEIVIGMVKNKLEENENALLDGFPRTINQAISLDKYLSENNKKITAVINLQVPDKDIITRTSSRVICSNKECGASFNTVFMKPKKEGICDICGSKLIKRADDNPETIEKRLNVYHKNTEPLENYYKERKVFEGIDINIYNPTTREDTTREALKRIDSRLEGND